MSNCGAASADWRSRVATSSCRRKLWNSPAPAFKAESRTELDVTRAAALLASMQAAIPPLETAVREAMYGLAVLLGQQPGELVAELSPPRPVPPVPPEIPIGLPSDLLRRRPDVRRAERQLAAETARIGVAKSEWFPKLSLTGDAGTESVSLSKWFDARQPFLVARPELAMAGARFRPGARGSAGPNRRARGGAGDL